MQRPSTMDARVVREMSKDMHARPRDPRDEVERDPEREAHRDSDLEAFLLRPYPSLDSQVN